MYTRQMLGERLRNWAKKRPMRYVEIVEYDRPPHLEGLMMSVSECLMKSLSSRGSKESMNQHVRDGVHLPLEEKAAECVYVYSGVSAHPMERAEATDASDSEAL